MEIDIRGVVVDRARQDGAPIRALDGVDLAIARNECVVIMGASGAGKSTLALVLAGVLRPTAGTIAGSALGSVRLVAQRPESSFLTERVLDEVSLAARWAGHDRISAEHAARRTLDALGLPVDIAARDPLTLSGGEQRRIAVAAVLAADPRVALLDEPSAGLDAAARKQLRSMIEAARAAGSTFVVITHDPEEAARLATRLVVVREGRIAWDGDPRAVLTDPDLAQGLGIATSRAVRLVDTIARSRGVAPEGAWIDPREPGRVLATIMSRPAVAASGVARELASRAAIQAGPNLEALPVAIDARVRVLAAALVVVASLAAGMLALLAMLLAAIAVVVRLGRIDRAQVRASLRPLIALAITLVVLQMVSGVDGVRVDIWPGWSSEAPGALAARRTLQVATIILASLVLSARTSTVDLADAFSRMARPLRIIRVPVDAMALITATGIGFVPVLYDELERLRVAQAGRGIRARGRGPIARMRRDALLLLPLFVLAFRRAHLLAEALTVRGYDPNVPRTRWRRQHVPPGDIVVMLCALTFAVTALLL